MRVRINIRNWAVLLIDLLLIIIAALGSFIFRRPMFFWA
jgi:hypothetical protein